MPRALRRLRPEVDLQGLPGRAAQNEQVTLLGGVGIMSGCFARGMMQVMVLGEIPPSARQRTVGNP